MRVHQKSLLAKRSAKSLISILLCDSKRVAFNQRGAERGVLGGWRVHYINSFILHWKSLWEQRLILSDLYLVRAYIMMANQVNTYTAHTYKVAVYVRRSSQKVSIYNSKVHLVLVGFQPEKNYSINWIMCPGLQKP